MEGAGPVALLRETLVGGSEGRVLGSSVGSMCEGRTHLVLNHGHALSVREVLRNGTETLLRTLPFHADPVLWMSCVTGGRRSAVFTVRASGRAALLALVRNGEGPWELSEIWSRSLRLPPEARLSEAVRCQ